MNSLKRFLSRWIYPLYVKSPFNRRTLHVVLAVHNDLEFLPDLFANIANQVDGVIALDDGSTDGSRDFLEKQPLVKVLICNPPSTPHVWLQAENQKKLYDAAGSIGAKWIIALDADERLEENFREKALDEIKRAEREGILAYYVNLKEMWNPRQYRSDGVWDKKVRSRFFRWRKDAVLDMKPRHTYFAPLNSKINGDYPRADLNLYHLKMINPQAREERKNQYQKEDPGNDVQKIGYGYLTDESGLELTDLPNGRGFFPLINT